MKGKGYAPAEAAADKYHGVQKFDVITGEQAKAPPGPPAYQNVFGETLAKLAETDRRSEEHTSELQSLMRISYAVFCLKKNNIKSTPHHTHKHQHTPQPHLH